jgi:hypothetical protein
MLARHLHRKQAEAHKASVNLTQKNSSRKDSIMKKFNQPLLMAGVALLFCLGATRVTAQQDQGRGDPAQFRQRMMDRYKEQLEVKSDDEWKVLQERIDKVLTARRDLGGFGGGGMGGFAFGRPPRGGGDGNNPQPSGDNPPGGRRGGRGGFGGPPSPESEALQKAIESKAPADEVKAKLAALREARKAKEASLEKAQEDLRKVLTVRQEAAAVLAGLLK